MATLKKTFSVSVSPSLLEKIDSEAESLGMTRSAFVAMTCSVYFRSIEATNAMNNTSDLIDRLKQMQEKNQATLWALETAKNDI